MYIPQPYENNKYFNNATSYSERKQIIPSNVFRKFEDKEGKKGETLVKKIGEIMDELKLMYFDTTTHISNLLHVSA